MSKESRKAKKERKKNAELEEVVTKAADVGKKVEKKGKAFWADFKKFVAKGNVVDLAVAVVVGAAFNKIVNTLVSGIITPLTSMLLNSDNLADLKFVMRPGIEAVEADPENGIEAVEAVSEIALKYGEFIQAILDFLVIALTIYVVLKVFMKLKRTIHRREIEAAEARAKIEAEKKKVEAEAEAARQEKIRKDFIEDVSVQADVLTEIKEIMLRMEAKQNDGK